MWANDPNSNKSFCWLISWSSTMNGAGSGVITWPETVTLQSPEDKRLKASSRDRTSLFLNTWSRSIHEDVKCEWKHRGGSWAKLCSQLLCSHLIPQSDLSIVPARGACREEHLHVSQDQHLTGFVRLVVGFLQTHNVHQNKAWSKLY